MEWGREDLLPCGIWGRGVKTGFVRDGLSRNVEHVFIYGGTSLMGKKMLANGIMGGCLFE